MPLIKRLLPLLLLIFTVPMAPASEADATGGDSVRYAVSTTTRVEANLDTASIVSHSRMHLLPDTTNNRNWLYLARHGKLDMKDPTVEYPRFIRFCVNVYNWADKAFNSYDLDYVTGTGKRWKARLVSDNWTDSYAMGFGDKGSTRMMSDVVSNFGPYIQYMAVSLGYSFNLNHLINGDPISHKKMEFGFNCARFNIDFSYTENTGGTYLRRISTYKSKPLFKSYFSGVDLYTLSVDAYYFLNNKKYSQGAAYNFSKIQKRSAGSFIAGFSYAFQDISLDFSTLQPDIMPYFKEMGLSQYFYKFHYNNFCILLGYGHNFVLNPHFLFNITVMPAIGFNHCYEDSFDGKGDLLSLNAKGKMSLTYNVRNFFAGIQAKADGHWYRSSSSSFLNVILNLNLSAGFRF